MKNKKITVIIPTYNEEKCIVACVNSMLEQSYKPIELLIVDDGSTDQTLLLLDELQRSRFEIRLLKQKHQGPAKARNYAAKEAKGEILIFMDADMTFDKDFVRDLIKPILAGKYRGTFSKQEWVANWRNVWARCWNYNLNLVKPKMIPDDYPDEGQDFRAILKSEFIRVGGFDDTGYTDTWTLAKKLGYKPHVVEGAIYYHNNPDNLIEVFTQAKWVAKRSYKLSVIGLVGSLIRASLPISFFIGVYKAAKYFEIRFLVFKMIYDLGSMIGILEMVSTGKLAK